MKENAAYNEQFVGECLKKIRKAPDAEEGLNQLLRFLGERLECDRGYVFEKGESHNFDMKKHPV